MGRGWSYILRCNRLIDYIEIEDDDDDDDGDDDDDDDSSGSKPLGQVPPLACSETSKSLKSISGRHFYMYQGLNDDEEANDDDYCD